MLCSVSSLTCVLDSDLIVRFLTQPLQKKTACNLPRLDPFAWGNRLLSSAGDPGTKINDNMISCLVKTLKLD